MSIEQLNSQFNALKMMVDGLEREKGDFVDKQRKNAAPRLRKTMLDISKHCGEMRKSVLEHKKSLPIKARVKNAPLENIDVAKEAEAATQAIVPEMKAAGIDADMDEPMSPVKKKKRVRKPTAVKAE